MEAATAVLPEAPIARPKRLPGWAVLLHNDDVNEIEFVVRSVVELVRIPVGDALDRTLEAHDSGVAMLVVTHREKAELLQEQLASRGLTVTIEPAA
jgi:ATP-dependent Clp protease adaptor protein ClpS